VCCGHLRNSKHEETYLHPETGPSSKSPTGADSVVAEADSAVTETAIETDQ